MAREERPGTCHLELPEDIADETSDVPLIAASYVRRPLADDKALATAADAIRRSERPLLDLTVIVLRDIAASRRARGAGTDEDAVIYQLDVADRCERTRERVRGCSRSRRPPWSCAGTAFGRSVRRSVTAAALFSTQYRH